MKFSHQIYRSTASDTEVGEIDLTDKDWAGYDEAGVSIEPLN
jgi:hypothetical protein